MIWRWASGGLALALAIAAAVIWQQQAGANPGEMIPPAPEASRPGDYVSTPAAAPEASPKSREERRFARQDKDKDGGITREEYLMARRKAYAKLDINGDGRLSFEEWAVKTTTKFATADSDRSGVLTPAEFATTAVKRKSKPPCQTVRPAARDEEDSDT